MKTWNQNPCIIGISKMLSGLNASLLNNLYLKITQTIPHMNPQVKKNSRKHMMTQRCLEHRSLI